MNVQFFAFALAGGLGLITLAHFVYYCLCNFSERTANDVLPFLQKVDLEEVIGVFHPEVEEKLRESHSAPEFRKLQWKRFHLAIHYCTVLAANAGVLLSWVRHERKHVWGQIDDGLQGVILELRSVCAQCRMAGFFIRMRLRWWLVRMALFPFAPPPSFRKLIGTGSFDLVGFYEKVKALAEMFSLAYGEDYHQKLMSAL